MTVGHKAWCKQRRRELLSRTEKSEDNDLEIRTLSFFIERNYSDEGFAAKLAKRLQDDRASMASSARICKRILEAWSVASGEIDSGIEPTKRPSRRPPSLTQNLRSKPGSVGDPELGGWRPIDSV